MEDQNSEVERRHPPGLSRDDIITILKHDAFFNILHQFIQHGRSTQFWKSISFVIMAFLGIGGFYLAWMATLETNKIESHRMYDERQAALIEQKITNKINWMRKTDQAMIDLRKTHEYIVLHCKYDTPLSKYQQALLRSNAQFELNKSFTGIEFIFDENIHQKFHGFINFDRTIPDVCAPNAPTDDTYLQYAHELINLMGQSIQKDKNALDELQ